MLKLGAIVGRAAVNIIVSVRISNDAAEEVGEERAAFGVVKVASGTRRPCYPKVVRGLGTPLIEVRVGYGGVAIAGNGGDWTLQGPVRGGMVVCKKAEIRANALSCSFAERCTLSQRARE